MKKLWFVIFGLTAIIVLLILFDKDDLSDQQHADYQRIANEWKDVAQEAVAEAGSILDAAIKRKEKDSIVIRAQDSKIKALTNKATIQRPQVIERIKADTAVLSYVTTLEEVVNELQVQNDTLKSAVAFHIQIEKDLSRTSKVMREAFENQLKLQEDLANQYKQDARREKRKVKVWKVATVLGTVGAFMLGAQ